MIPQLLYNKSQSSQYNRVSHLRFRIVSYIYLTFFYYTQLDRWIISVLFLYLYFCSSLCLENPFPLIFSNQKIHTDPTRTEAADANTYRAM